MEITTYRLSGQRAERRFVADFAPEAVRLVRQRKAGPMPATRIVLTTTGGLQEMGLESMGKAAGVPRHLWPNAGPLRADHGVLYACTVLAPHGVDILIAVREAARLAGLDAVLLHEPVHALQFGTSTARRDELRYLHHTFGIQQMTTGDLWRNGRRRTAEEREAQRIEHRLLSRI
ncbi:hypothetical protein ACIOUE_37795 [Streptomyces xanthochromogenes]|uniref:hypothetical protein n=1 Tax=Streptomyces xanthochromogenes TaxID=67384 RepID=UPI0037FCC7F8